MEETTTRGGIYSAVQSVKEATRRSMREMGPHPVWAILTHRVKKKWYQVMAVPAPMQTRPMDVFVTDVPAFQQEQRVIAVAWPEMYPQPAQQATEAPTPAAGPDAVKPAAMRQTPHGVGG